MTLAVDIGCSCTAATTASSVLDLSAALSGRESAAARELHAGTPSYISPEQWPGETANAPTDLFAIAVTPYQWLAGRLPNGEIKPCQAARDPVMLCKLGFALLLLLNAAGRSGPI